MKPLVSIVLIREYAEQLTGSGCCGKLEGDNAALGGGQAFAHVRGDLRGMGLLHRAVREFFAAADTGAQIQVVSVDPRNQLYLLPKLWGDVWRYRPGLWAGMKTALQCFSLPAVIVNGRVISSRKRPVDPDTLCHVVQQQLPQPEAVERA